MILPQDRRGGAVTRSGPYPGENAPPAPPHRPTPTAAELQQRFPGTRIWHGRHTRSWWAYVPVNGGRLVEADHPERLMHAIIYALVWPWPP